MDDIKEEESRDIYSDDIKNSREDSCI